MKKRGATIKHQNATMPGLLALAVCPGYETRLRLAVNALSEGWMEEGQFNDLADTLDMLQIGMASYSQQKPDPSTAVAIDVCREAMMSIRGRYMRTGKFGATGEELKAVQLLADVSLDFWNRRSGALFAFACQQLKELRAEQREQAKQSKEETEMNARDNAPALPVIDGTINAAHGLLMAATDALSADQVAATLKITKKAATVQLKELQGLGLLENEPRRGGTMYFRLAVVVKAEVCESVQTGSGSQAEDSPISDEVRAQIQSLNTRAQWLAPEDYELPPADPVLLASANRMLSNRLEGVAHALRGCGLPALAEISGAEDLQMATAALSGAYRVAEANIQALEDYKIQSVREFEALGEAVVDYMPDLNGSSLIDGIRTMELLIEAHWGYISVQEGRIVSLSAIANSADSRINSLVSDVTNTRRALNDALNEADRMRSELTIERQARAALQEQMSAAPAPAAKGYVLKTSNQPMRGFRKQSWAQSAAMAAARAGKSSEVFALVPVGKAVRGAEWKAV